MSDFWIVVLCTAPLWGTLWVFSAMAMFVWVPDWSKEYLHYGLNKNWQRLLAAIFSPPFMLVVLGMMFWHWLNQDDT